MTPDRRTLYRQLLEGRDAHMRLARIQRERSSAYVYHVHKARYLNHLAVDVKYGRDGR